MRLYIDKKNIESLMISASSDPGRFDACNMMLKKHFDMRLNLTLQDFSCSELCMMWGNTLLDGRGANNINFCSDSNPVFPSRPINADSFDQNFDTEESLSVFLLDENEVPTLAHKGNFLIAGPGEELDTLSRLMIGDDDNKYTQSLPLRTEFANGNWDGLDNSILPCSDIIISDPYILSNSGLLHNNLISLLKKLTEKVRNSSVNIVIFCLKETRDRSQNMMVQPNWSVIRSQIKRVLSSIGIVSKVTFVAPNDEVEFGEHDRTAFTNYLLYIPGSTFNFYNLQGLLTSRGRHFHVHCSAHSDYYKEAVDFISDMQRIVDEIHNGAKAGVIVKDVALKLSNVLNIQ